MLPVTNRLKNTRNRKISFIYGQKHFIFKLTFLQVLFEIVKKCSRYGTRRKKLFTNEKFACKFISQYGIIVQHAEHKRRSYEPDDIGKKV